jgi:hypothetical protein
MAEPYVPIAEFNASNVILTELEVTVDAAEGNANSLVAAQDAALASRNLAQAALAGDLNLFFLAGA